MELSVINFGNSKLIKLPAHICALYEIGEKVELSLFENQIVIMGMTSSSEL